MDTTEVNELIERTKAESLNRRRAAAQELRTILLKEGKPGKSDHARLLELAGSLGIEAEQLPEVLETVQQLEWCQKVLADADARQVAYKAATDAVAQAEKAEEARRQQAQREAEERMRPLLEGRSTAFRLTQEVNEAKRKESTLAIRWMAILLGISTEEAFDREHPRAAVVEGPRIG